MAWFDAVKAPSWIQVSSVVAAAAAAGLITGAAVGDRSAASPRARAQTLVAEVQESSNAKLADEPLAQARDALERAQKLRDTKDTQHAEMLEAVALEWAQTAQALMSAVDAEAQADALQDEAIELEDKAVRAQALVEETVARLNRAQAKLDALQQNKSGSDDETQASGSKEGQR